MNGKRHDSEFDQSRSVELTRREGLALLAALELSPFEDEVLEQKLLNLVYSRQKEHASRPRHRSHDFTHHRR